MHQLVDCLLPLQSRWVLSNHNKYFPKYRIEGRTFTLARMHSDMVVKMNYFQYFKGMRQSTVTMLSIGQGNRKKN